MPREWWQDFVKTYLEGDKFHYQPLQLEDESDILFGASAAIGEINCIPSSTSSSTMGKQTLESLDADMADAFYEPNMFYGAQEEPPTHSCPNAPRSSVPSTSSSRGQEATSPHRPSQLPRVPVVMKKPRTVVGQQLGSSIECMCEVMELRTKLMFGDTSKFPEFFVSMEMVERNEQIPNDTQMYFFSIEMLRDIGNCEVFCSFPTDIRRAN
ncbi:hypothetical protein QJS04_geneDACA022944 [Acorus gramineus]|uniref:Uncharacterized protein n=1 Tax=Acorus gramineus TaxID=55184 RepID=A0AAV9ANF3_ACOGR|nr:hypothetical protein QJS04_geneDACA022944 [Acorus gramineus]